MKRLKILVNPHMNLYYNEHKKVWFHQNNTKSIKVGGLNLLLNDEKPSDNDHFLSFETNLLGSKVGPFIGIMMSRTKDGRLMGNRPIIENLGEQLLKWRAIPFAFSPDDLFEDKVTGLLLHSKTRKWIPAELPLPDAVYNRIPNRKYENTEQFFQAVKYFKKHDIPFFNPHFLDKYDCYQYLKEHRQLQKYLPETTFIQEKESLYSFLKEHGSIYIKPSFSSRGKGIHVVRINDDGSIVTKSPERVKFFISYDHYWNTNRNKFSEKSYIAQKAITPKKINGKRYDFRVLAHYLNDKYEITGIGVRQSRKQNVTTHIPRGGKLLSFDPLNTPNRIKHIQKILQGIGEQFKERNEFFGEISIDIGESIDGNLYIFEINSKPMTFDEPHIEKKRITSLAKILMQTSGFKMD